MTTDKPIWTVTGRTWDATTRTHSKLQSIDFERHVDALGFMSFNRDWIAGMVLDRNAAAARTEAYTDVGG